MKTRFLTKENLSKQIKNICKGEDLKIAVAFIGINAEKNLFKEKGCGAKIICDITMGGTNPKALEKLGAPTNKNLRSIENLHAKVYISNNGAVVCSANASNNGIGFVNGPSHIEAGIFVKADTQVFKQVEDWFEGIWQKAKQIDDAGLNQAENRFQPRFDFGSNDECSLQDLIDEPRLFGDWGIVLTTDENSTSEYERNSAKKIGQKEWDSSGSSPKEANDVYSDWGKDCKRFPEYCVNIHLDNNNRMSIKVVQFGATIKDYGGSIFAYKLSSKQGDKGYALSNALRQNPKVKKLAMKWAKKGEGKLYVTAKEFVDALKKIELQMASSK